MRALKFRVLVLLLEDDLMGGSTLRGPLRDFSSTSGNGGGVEGKHLEILIWNFEDVDGLLGLLPQDELVVERHPMP